MSNVAGERIPAGPGLRRSSASGSTSAPSGQFVLVGLNLGCKPAQFLLELRLIPLQLLPLALVLEALGLAELELRLHGEKIGSFLRLVPVRERHERAQVFGREPAI